MERIAIKQVFRVLFWDDDSFVAGEFQPDIYKTKDFLVFTQALQFAKEQSSTAQIEATHIYNKYPFEEVVRKWEVSGNEYCIMESA